MESNFISIILPVYNGETFLKKSIESVVNQTYKNWELLVLDDCSTDSTAEIVKEYELKDSRIHYYRNEKNLKLPRNLNKGFSLAKGNWLTWTSDDNYYFPDALEQMLIKAKWENAEYVIASSIIVNVNDEHIEDWYTPENAGEMMIGASVGNACFLYSRKVYETIGDYDPEMILCEDWDYWQRICQHFKPAVITEALYAYRRHDKSLTSTLKKEEINKNIKKMLLKNVEGFGRLNYRQRYYFYSALCECNKELNEVNCKDDIKNKFYNFLYFFMIRIPTKLRK